MNFHNDVPEPVEGSNFNDDLLKAVNTLASGESVEISLRGVDKSIWLMPFNHLYTRMHSFTHVPIEGIRVKYDPDAEVIRICNFTAPPAPPAPPAPDPVDPGYSPQSKWFN